MDIKQAGIVALTTLTSIAHAQTIDKPNVILIVTDDQGLDLGCYGNTAIKTPNIDYLASQGVLFKNAYCTSSSSSASRSVILTGMHNHANGHYGHSHVSNHFRTFETVVSLPRYMADNGYRTAHIGKWHLAPDSIYPFDKRISSNVRNTVEMAQKAGEFISENPNKPFFMYFCPYDCHDDGTKFENLPYKPDTHGNHNVYPGVVETKYNADSVLIPPFLPDLQQTRAWLAQYYQSISRIDQGVGKLIKYLKDNNLWETTVIIYGSDNGINLTGGKTNAYEPGVNVPFIIRNPFIQAKGVTTNAIVNYTDIMPTILDIAGILPSNNILPAHYFKSLKHPWEDTPNRDKIQGHSMLEILKNPQITTWDTTYLSHTFHGLDNYYPMRTIVTTKYKLIINLAHELPYPCLQEEVIELYKKSPVKSFGAHIAKDYVYRSFFELYDLQQDPLETTNLAYNKKYVDIRNVLVQKVRNFQKNTNDPFITLWKLYDKGIKH